MSYSKTIFVGNLSWTTNDIELRRFCESIGRVVRVDIKRFPDTLRSKGWGVVEYENIYDAIVAVQRLDMAELNGRFVHVRFDRESIDEYDNPNAVRVFVGNIAWDVTEIDLRYHFQSCQPTRLRLMTNMAGKSRGFALLQYNDLASAERAIAAFNRSIINSREIQCRIDRGPGRDTVARAPMAIPVTNLFVKNLHLTCCNDELISIFSRYGSISNVNIMRNSTGAPNCWGVVSFYRYQDAVNALRGLSGQFSLPGMPPIDIRLDRSR